MLIDLFLLIKVTAYFMTLGVNFAWKWLQAKVSGGELGSLVPQLFPHLVVSIPTYQILPIGFLLIVIVRNASKVASIFFISLIWGYLLPSQLAELLHQVTNLNNGLFFVIIFFF